MAADDLDLLIVDGDGDYDAQVRCMISHGQRGHGRCPNPAKTIAVTAMSHVPHLVIRVCDEHAETLPPPWEIVLRPRVNS